MSNVNIEEAFEGLDDAKAVDRYPKLPPNGDFLLEVTRTELVDGYRSGLTFVIEHRVLQSSLPDVVIGGMYSTTITKLKDKQSRDLKLGKVKGFIGAVTGLDTSAKKPWMQIAGYFCKKQAAFGARVKAQTGPRTIAETSKKEYTPVNFMPPPADKLTDLQKKFAATL